MSNAFDFYNLLTRCNVAKRYLEADFSQFSEEFRQIGLNGESLFVSGPRGTGKTHFLCACIRIAVQEKLRKGEEELLIDPRNRPIEFLSVPELMLQFKQSYNRDKGMSDADILDRYSRLELLALDDLGAERVNNWSIQMLYLLIDRRYRDMKRTIISSNLSLSEVSQNLDDRIASRILEMCRSVKFQGRDKRAAKRKTSSHPTLH